MSVPLLPDLGEVGFSTELAPQEPRFQVRIPAVILPVRDGRRFFESGTRKLVWDEGRLGLSPSPKVKGLSAMRGLFSRAVRMKTGDSQDCDLGFSRSDS